MTKIYSIALATLLLSSIHAKAQKTKSLFNGKNLKGWETFIGSDSNETPAPGFNPKNQTIFSVQNLEKEPVICISGEVNAALTTRKSFSNYHLQLKFKYGQKVYKKRNSGILYHSVGDYGVGLGVWKSSHELQLMHGNVGDSYRMGNTFCNIPSVPRTNSKGYIYSQTASKNGFSKSETCGPMCKKDKNVEKPLGEWNVIDLYCFDQTSIHVVNEEVVMINYNSQLLNNGETSPLTSGQIQIQSEGGELFLKNITIESIDELPQQLL